MATLPEVVSFEDPRVRRKRLTQEWASVSSRGNSYMNAKKNTGDADGVFDVEKARYEVLKFGITNEKERDKRLSAKQQLLVSLGAKAPKNKYVNYKELKRELEEKKQTRSYHGDQIIGGASQGLARRDRKRKKQELDVTAGYGKLKNGELVVGADVRRTMKKVQQNAKRRQEQQKLKGRRTK